MGSLKCSRCLELKAQNFFYQVRIVPLTGRAAQNGLCCKHDRELHGRQTDGEKGKKQQEIAARKAARRGLPPDTYGTIGPVG